MFLKRALIVFGFFAVASLSRASDDLQKHSAPKLVDGAGLPAASVAAGEFATGKETVRATVSSPSTEQRHDYSILPPLMHSAEISKLLRSISNDDLGMLEMQRIYDRLAYKSVSVDAGENIDELAHSIDQKLLGYQTALNTTSIAVQRLHSKAPVDMQIFRNYKECCILGAEQLSPSSFFFAKVNTSLCCDVVPIGFSPFSFYPSQNLTPTFQNNRNSLPSLKWQYFISADGLHIEYPAHNFDLLNNTNCLLLENQRHRSAYIATTLPFGKNVVIIVDHGNSMSSSQLSAAKTAAKSLLSGLSHRDRVSIVAISDKVVSAFEGSCDNGQQFAFASQETKYILERFIDSLSNKDSGKTNHSAAFERAFDHIHRLSREHSGYFHFIMYISRGLLGSLDEAGKVIATIAVENLKQNNMVRIKTFAIVDHVKKPMLETKFLEDVATQNLTRYAQSLPTALLENWNRSSIRPPIGKMFIVNGTQYLYLSLQTLYESYALHSTSLKGFVPASAWGVFQYSEPHWDKTSKGLIVSMTRPAYGSDTQLLGVVGADLHLSDLTEHVSYHSAKDVNSYAMLFDKDGNTLTHTKLTRPLFWSKEPLEVNMAQQEDPLAGHDALRSAILNDRHGTRSIVNGNTSITYVWKRLKNAPFVVVIASRKEKADFKSIAELHSHVLSNVVYHRLDLSPPEPLDTLCYHLKQLSTKAAVSLFLSARCFQEPFRFLMDDETKLMGQGIITFIGDETRPRLISNPGLKLEVREEVIAAAHIAGAWKRTADFSHYAKNILRRYIATPSGAILVYPGTILDKYYDPLSRDWYQRALQYPGRLVFSSPYLDLIGGAGYIVTMSSTIYEGKQSSLHRVSDQVMAVMAMDLPFGFLYEMLVKALPVCTEKFSRCFLFDDRGYLVHPGQTQIDPKPEASIEQLHVTRQESLIMCDLLSNTDASALLVQKVLCNRYADGTVQRSYAFNTSFAAAVRNKKSDACVKYHIVAVPQTNLFLGIVNQTCARSSFVPCSITDRRCLNCHRADPVECECPCECPLHFDLCTRRVLEPLERARTCPRPEEPLRYVNVDFGFLSNAHLSACYDVRCHEYADPESCDGAVGCAWCTKESDQDLLAQPFCAQISICFGGVRGLSSYFDRNIRSAISPEGLVASTPVGPVAGGIMAVFVLLVVAVYCYRHQMSRLLENARMNGQFGGGVISDSGSRLHPTDDGEDECRFDDGTTKKIVLASFERQNIHSINPFRLINQRRRPPATSDHGYSTMAQSNEDSEHATTVDSVVGENRATNRVRPGQRFGALANAETTKLLLVNKPVARGAAASGSSGPEETDADSACGSVAASAASTVGTAVSRWLPRRFAASKSLATPTAAGNQPAAMITALAPKDSIPLGQTILSHDKIELAAANIDCVVAKHCGAEKLSPLPAADCLANHETAFLDGDLGTSLSPTQTGAMDESIEPDNSVVVTTAQVHSSAIDVQ